MYWHLAQVNIARAVAPLSDPRLADFAARIEEVNALADQAPGFVWRDAGGEPPADRADPCLLYNASVWESVEALKDYVYRGGHVEAFRERARWFTPGKGPRLAMWWVPAGHRPDSREAFERLDFLSTRGPTAAAFTFKQTFPAPDSPADSQPGPPSAIDYNGRRLIIVENTPNGDVQPGLSFEYRQQDRRVWATYSSPGVLFGGLSAAVASDGALDARYRHFTPDGEAREGRCRSEPSRTPDGRIRLTEHWQWTSGDGSSGVSVVEEATDAGTPVVTNS